MLLNDMIFYTFYIVKIYYICSQGILLSSNKLLDKFLFIAGFAFVLQRRRAKPLPLVGRGFTPAASLA